MSKAHELEKRQTRIKHINSIKIHIKILLSKFYISIC